jgi:hypothetical protein
MNHKTVGHIGERLFVLPSGALETGVKGACCNIDISVLFFNNANGKGIMCAAILISMKDIFRGPTKIKLGMDRKIESANGESYLNKLEAILESNVMLFGANCAYQGKSIPCLNEGFVNRSFTT